MAPLFLFLLQLSTVLGQLGDCDPIDPSKCYLPFPNNFWLRLDSVTNKTHLTFSNSTFPLDKHGRGLDPEVAGYNAVDGWPVHGGIATYFANLSISNLPPYYHMQESLAANCPSVLLDTETGKPVAHFAELDASAQDGRSELPQLFIMWPGQQLKFSNRYIVAYRFLKTLNGSAVQSSDGFLALRDNITTTDPNIELRRDLFEDIFTRLEQLGWARNSIQLAWDFTTASRNDITGRLTHMRDDAFQRVAKTGITYEILEVYDNYSDQAIRRVEGRMRMPQYVDQMTPGAHLVIDPTTNLPAYTGEDIHADFTVVIPRSLVKNVSGVITTSIGMIMQYGHGLFGKRTEVLDGYLQQQAFEHGYVMIASDWIGMTEDDLPAAIDMMLTNFSDFKIIPERTSQGVLRALFLQRLFKEGKIWNDPAMTFSGQPVLDSTSPRYYYGNSNGGILGTVYMATSTDVTRGCLGVGGGSYSLLLPRSRDFLEFYDIIKDFYPDTIDRIALVLITEVIWIRAESGGYMGSVTSNPLPNTQAKEVLLQHGLGDCQVSYVGVYVLGRSVGASMFQSNVNEPNEELYGFNFIPDNAIGKTAMEVTWYFPGIPPVPEIDIPPRGTNDTHGGPRKQTNAQDMMYQFFISGEIVNTCGGPCYGTLS